MPRPPRSDPLRKSGLSLSLLLLSGCALFGPSPPAQPETILNDYEELIGRVRTAAWQADSWSGLCEMEYSRGGEFHSADAVVLVASPARLYLELTGPMGVALGAMALADGRLTVNNLHEGWRWEGAADADEFQRIGLPAESGTRLVALLTGGELPPENGAGPVQWNYDPRTARYRIEEEIGGQIRRWEIDPFQFTVLRQVTEKEGFSSTAEYAEYHAGGLRLVPTLMKIEARGTGISLDCPVINLNVPLTGSDFELPTAPGLRMRSGPEPPVPSE